MKFKAKCRKIHGHLSFFFIGMILIYAISGIAMNHLKNFDPHYQIISKQYIENKSIGREGRFSDAEIKSLLARVHESDKLLKAFYPNPHTLKVFLKGGSFYTLNMENGMVDYAGIKKRPFFSQLSFLHRNPNKWWSYFSDIFCICLIIIALTGIIIPSKKNGIRGLRGVELATGIIIPILFLLFS